MRRLVTLALMLVMVLGIAAAPAVAQEPLANGEMEVHIWPAIEPGEILVIVGITVPESVPLPVTVRLPILEDTTIKWAGEISSETASADIAVETQIKDGEDGKYAEFVVTTFRRAQIELGGVKYSVKGTVISGQIEFVQSAPAELTAFAVRLPATASDIEIEPESTRAPTRNSAGESLYTLPSKELAPGESQTVKFSYDTALPRTKAPMDTATLVVIVLSVLAMLAMAAVAVLLWRQRKIQPVRADGDVVEAEHEDDELFD